jgi:hypothetical protein
LRQWRSSAREPEVADAPPTSKIRPVVRSTGSMTVDWMPKTWASAAAAASTARADRCTNWQVACSTDPGADSPERTVTKRGSTGTPVNTVVPEPASRWPKAYQSSSIRAPGASARTTTVASPASPATPSSTRALTRTQSAKMDPVV